MFNSLENGLLKGLNVLELTEGSSGGYAGRLLACSGATVTKVMECSERRLSTLDAVKKIIATADIIKEVTTLLHKPWDLVLWDSQASHGLELLLEDYFFQNNKSIGVKIELPEGFRGDEESQLQAIGGWLSLTGHPEKAPLCLGGNPASYLLGTHAATAGLFALIERAWGGKGRLIHIHALTILVSALEGAYSTYLATGIARRRQGNRHHAITPMTILPCQDGWVFVGAPVDEKWRLLERWVGIQSPLEWSDMEGRMKNRFELERTLGEWTRNLPQEELFLTGQGFRLPFAKVQGLKEIRGCPQLGARNFWIEDGKTVNIRLPWRVHESCLNVSSQLTRNVDTWQGLRVLDLTNMWSGPYCTRIFADMGAEVIKVEAGHRPDGIRSNQGVASPFFRELNRNKWGIQLDLNNNSDRHLFLKIVGDSDILVENFSPRVMSNFGLPCEELWKYRPDLLILSLSAFGQSGPYRDFVGYGSTLECMAGLAALTHYPDGEPCLPGFSISDIGAGIHGAFALLTALFVKKQKGKGVWIDLSQYETACQFAAENLINGGFQAERGLPAVKDLSDIVRDGQVVTMPLPDGNPVLGTPWSSEGWNVPNIPPPELGQHNRLLVQRFLKADRSNWRDC